MKLVSDWKRVLQRAWSIRLMLIAGALSGLEFALPYLDGYVDIPPRLFAALSGLTVAAAFVARLVAQKDVSDGK
ncbi:hypothetical protein HJB79_31425 [Rhizobium lentis]|uniref:DUF7940 domain-containing protein n=1 Tax=Rhizobium lentis TaxID=1138194 RepID=UPI001C828E8E|nr:hypothetical protein [Rhizobium lentis]MBX5143221.1 hypothetical protein [Rhizobium lentis]